MRGGADIASGGAFNRRGWNQQERVRTQPAPREMGNIDRQLLASLFTFCTAIYICCYAFEAPIRYALYLYGYDNLILLRDGLILGPLVILMAAQALRLRIHPAFFVAGALLAFHGLVLVGTIGDLGAVAYAMKMMANVLFGFFLAGLLIAPGKKMLVFLIAIWLATIVGLLLDKFVFAFPWVGISTTVGDLTVNVARDWEIQDTLARRVGGFTRSSISAAIIVPLLAIVIMGQCRVWLLRGFVAVASLGAAILTTQKGAIIALTPIAGILCLPPSWRPTLLRLSCVTFLLAAVSIPFLTLSLHIPHGNGVFSAESIYLRIAYTWPRAWQWIMHHQMLFFGVGLGGLGGPQRLYAPENFNPADNFFILMYAYFGVFAVLYLLLVCILALRQVTGSKERATIAVALLAFVFGYGTVLSIIEDQAAALFLGAALGVLWRETRRTVSIGASAAPWAAQDGAIGN
jgi:hypothetical protein